LNSQQGKTVIARMQRKERILKWLCFFLSAAVAGLIWFILSSRAAPAVDKSYKQQEAVPPFRKEVESIIGKLVYSGLPMLEQKDVSVSIDPENRLWTVRNIHRFDEGGNLVLEGGRYGTCGELASYTYKYVKPLFDGAYDIQFVRAVQSGYFQTPKATHMVLFITPAGGARGDNDIFVLDPSFHRYGRLDEFEDYLFHERMTNVGFVEDRERDMTLPISTAFPLLIKKNYLLAIVVEDVNGAFDKDNFVIAVTVTKKYNFAGRYLFAIRSVNGNRQVFENRLLFKNLLEEKEYEDLKARIRSFFDIITAS
jgi:hypothetical protein